MSDAGALERDDSEFVAELVAMIPRLRALATGLVGHRAGAEDLTQQTLERAYAARSSFTAGTSLKAWTYTILRNLYFSEHRQAWRNRPLAEGEAERIAFRCRSEDTLELNDVRMALSALPPEQREALILVSAAGMSYEEAAEASGLPIGTVKSRVNRARRTLQCALESGAFDRDDLPASQSLSLLVREGRERSFELQSKRLRWRTAPSPRPGLRRAPLAD